MKTVQKIEFHTGSKEELLPGYTEEFPYIATRVELDKYTGRYVPWHWHRAVEIPAESFVHLRRRKFRYESGKH